MSSAGSDLGSAVSATAVVNARGVGRIAAGHPWVFRQDVVRGPERDTREGGPLLVRVLDPRGRDLGIATWAVGSPIALRLLARGPGGSADRASQSSPDARHKVQDKRSDNGNEKRALLDLIGTRLAAASARRGGIALHRDAYRVVHAEADLLPGLIVDRYADALVLQTTSVAMNALRSDIASMLADQLGARIVVARDDGSARDFEGLPRTAEVLIQHPDDAEARTDPRNDIPHDASRTRIVYRLGPNQLEADLLTDAKTGGFLDQADNHATVAALAPHGARALDAFTYHGGFALALARRGGAVLATDESAAAVERARANAKRNALSNLEVRQANAFELLRQFESQRERFDVVVIDPPALAKRGEKPAPSRGSNPDGRRSGADLQSDHRAATRAYKELFLRGARLTAPGGLLVACSCSGRISRDIFDDLVAEAVADAGRSAHVLARRGAADDHPELVGVPETAYLKCWILRIL